MAKQPQFETEDIERLFRALLPTNRPDPFGEIEQRLLDIGNALLEGDEDTLKYQQFVKEELSDIKNKTFGILVLQIFRIIKFFFGLLPQGRIILLLIAGLGLASTILQGERPTLADVRAAAESTGLADFIDGILGELQRVVGEIEQSVEGVGQSFTEVFSRMTSDTAFLEGELSGAIAQLRSVVGRPGASRASRETPFEGQDIADRVQAALEGLQAMELPLEAIANAASNGSIFLPAILRAIEKRLREIPELASRMVSL